MRRLLLISLACLATACLTRGADEPFDLEVLQYRAKTLASQPYKVKPSPVPAWLLKYDYDQYRDIVYDPTRTWWRQENLPFQLQFFHPGFLYNRTVQVHDLQGKKNDRIEFSQRLFLYGRNKPKRIPADLGFAGFRVLCALNTPEPVDELVSFLGASYFRALGKDQRYGLSARGLAVNTAEAGGEEFPVFEEFWIERPAPEAKTITVYALMDSPSLAGAYRFVITPGVETVMRVRAAVYCRKNPRVLGIAPLTSMFAHGENSGWSPTDYRPEVHDSDGLLIESGSGEWIWRPLTNPKAVRIASFVEKSPRGFGLLQRDRQFEHYDDLEAYYHARPSVWVDPVGNWGPGTVRLVELPTPDETNDNIVACWVPEALPPAGEPLVFEYDLHWMTQPGRRPPAGYVASTKVASVPRHADLKRFVVEFTGAYLTAEPADPEIEAVLTVGPGARPAGHAVVQKNQFAGTWRVVFEIQPLPAGPPVELRCFLRKGPHVLTETWSYLWNP